MKADTVFSLQQPVNKSSKAKKKKLFSLTVLLCFQIKILFIFQHGYGTIQQLAFPLDNYVTV